MALLFNYTCIYFSFVSFWVFLSVCKIGTHIGLCVIQTKNYLDIKHAMSAEYCGTVDACILNLEKDGGILFSWEVSL